METNKTVTKQKRMPVYAGMPLNGNGDNKMKKVGYDIFQQTFEVINYPELNGYKDYVFISSKRIKRVFYN